MASPLVSPDSSEASVRDRVRIEIPPDVNIEESPSPGPEVIYSSRALLVVVVQRDVRRQYSGPAGFIYTISLDTDRFATFAQTLYGDRCD